MSGSRPDGRYVSSPLPSPATNRPPRPSVSCPITSKKFRPMPRTRTGLPAGTRDQSTSAGAAGGTYRSPSSSAAESSSRCSAFNRASRWPRASTTESTVSTVPSSSTTSNRTERSPRRPARRRQVRPAPGGLRGGVADGRRRRRVEVHADAGRQHGEQLLEGGPQVTAVEGPAGEVRLAEPGELGAFLVSERRVRVALLEFAPLVERAPGQGRRELRVLGDHRGIEGLRVHQVQPRLSGLPDVPRARRVRVDHVDVQGSRGSRRRPSWRGAVPARSCPGDRRLSLPSGCFAICPRHPAYRQPGRGLTAA